MYVYNASDRYSMHLTHARTHTHTHTHTHTRRSLTPSACRISYSLTKNRFCENVGRAHKSNRVLILCDLARGVWRQVSIYTFVPVKQINAMRTRIAS